MFPNIKRILFQIRIFIFVEKMKIVEMAGPKKKTVEKLNGREWA